ncbi:SCO7613 C-terminal domain-containing membrane protein [Blastococcus montanus]|uniref:SCO7613 C-terminal domain-containing membrane protein n=1 Tax=Blastococcus montanus TaxID=3144973 RepID=UPI003209C27C
MTQGMRTTPSAPVPPFPYRSRPPQVLLAVGAVLLVSAGATLASAYGGPVVRAALLALAGGAAAGSVRAGRAGLRSSAETFAASAAGLALAAGDVGAALTTGSALALGGGFLLLGRVSPATAAWPLAAWVAVQVAALRSLDAVPEVVRAELVLGVALAGLGVALVARPVVARAAAVTTAPWWAAGVLAGTRQAWTADAGGRWLAAGLVTAVAGGLLLARLREPLDVLLGPPRLVPAVSGAVTGAALAGASAAGGPVAVAVAGFVGVLLATVAPGELRGRHRGLLLPAAQTGGVLLAALSIARLVVGAHWSALALLLLLTAAPTGWVAAARPGDRPVAAPTAVGCLAGAALLGLPAGWASPAVVAAALTALYLLSLAAAAPLARDARRATVIAAAACAVVAVLLLLAGDDGWLALGHLTVQGIATLGWAWWTGRPEGPDAGDDAPAAWRAGAAQLVLAAWVAAALTGTGVVEAYTLPAAAGLLLAAGRRLVRDASWPAWGPGLLTAAVPSTTLAVLASDPVRPVLVLALAAAAMVAGARAGLRAPLVVGAGTALALALGLAVRALPWPVAAALAVGAVLLVVGTRRERTPVAGFAARLAELR